MRYLFELHVPCCRHNTWRFKRQRRRCFDDAPRHVALTQGRAVHAANGHAGVLLFELNNVLSSPIPLCFEIS